MKELWLDFSANLCTNEKVLGFNVPVYYMLSMAIYESSS